ncbi:cryptochrome/photolyase family protein [Pontibacter oryzae]|uniref:Deoxyribodipyrimidine photo-lyase n=1 Tax=Pontibacter oryzae TaxID=2304593 RepID=A0A399SGR0_9BACT|nr:deoxyribodipyrimidine photo-lyase [Pontibacter oryzae]RIJ42009.1 deoxyribodipyrimidine photo-lyase [Pontibacter oryzae]
MLLFWFRRDLRLHDNAGFSEALQSGHEVLPLFIFDKEILDKLDADDARVTFIHAQISEMHRQLEKHGSTLLVKYGKPLDVLSELMQEYDLEGIYTNHDYEPYARHRDQQAQALMAKSNLAFETFKDQVIFEQDEILTKSGTPYKVYTPYKNAWLKAFDPAMAEPQQTEPYFEHLLKHKHTKIISLDQMGFKESALRVPSPDLRPDTLKDYDKTRDLPAKDATTHISAHLRFGTVSVREMVQLGLQYNDTWLQELIWREFFMQLLYHFPEEVDKSFAPKFRHIVWRNNEDEFEKWCLGKTGFPLVDAGMRELNQSGFMHNRVRMVVASFLVKDLLIDWRWGEAYFAEKLLDYEMSSNVGNWQWAAGTGADAQPYFRVFNPDSQVAKFDKQHAYIKRWVPEFGTPDYPKPMVDHSMARDRALQAFKDSIADSGM